MVYKECTDMRRTWKNLITIMILLIIMALFLPQKTYAAKISLSEKKLVMIQYGTFKLKLQKNEKALKKVQWTSSKPKVAKVSKKGKITALKPGTCKIKARYRNKVYKCKVTVKPLALSASKISLVNGTAAQLKWNLGTNKKTIWISSDSSVASVDQNGNIKAISIGSAVITAKLKKVKKTCSITVTKMPATDQNSGPVVLAGSSSMAYWSSAQSAFSPYKIKNTAIGGTTVLQWIQWYRDKITQYKPRAVVIYVGSNDLDNGDQVTGSVNASNTIRLIKLIRNELQYTPIFYISVNPCYSRQGAWNEIAQSNTQMKTYCESQTHMYYIDIAAAFALSDGKPNSKLFLSDQLHPNEAGYAIWKTTVAGYVKEKLKALGISS